MADDVVLELGWGRLIFGQTFADADKLAEVLRGETHGRRDICIYAREPHVLVSRAPAELFIDPSHTYRLRFSEDDESAHRVRPDSPCAHCRTRPKPTRSTTSTSAAAWCPRRSTSSGTTTATSDPVDYLIAVRDDDGAVVGTVTGVDHKQLFADPENGSSLWTLAVDPTTSLPGVGAALTRALADDLPRPRPCRTWICR